MKKQISQAVIFVLTVSTILIGCAGNRTSVSSNPELLYMQAVAYNNQGLTHWQFGQYDQAIASYTKVLEIDPRFAEAYNNRGVAYHDKGQYDQAITDFNRALKINPEDPKIYKNRALAYHFKLEYEKTSEDLSKLQHLGYHPHFQLQRLALMPFIQEPARVIATP
ncbi:MAG: tetratricopeptide repeat protein [Candidatus Tectomicrobia bacterium]|nr:tetratricopeptide repeat protein [Candidatus Tectomicrobia bacterium]